MYLGSFNIKILTGLLIVVIEYKVWISGNILKLEMKIWSSECGWNLKP